MVLEVINQDKVNLNKDTVKVLVYIQGLVLEVFEIESWFGEIVFFIIWLGVGEGFF